MPSLSWGLLRLAPDGGPAVYARRELPLSQPQGRLLVQLMERLGEFVPAQALEPLSQASLGQLNDVLRKHCGAGYYVMDLQDSGLGLALPGLVPRLRSEGAGRGVNTLPRLRGRVVGREDVARSLAEAMAQSRLVSIVGAGGIGKTTAAVDVAQRIAGGYADGTYFVDLSFLRGGDLVPTAVGTAIQMPISGAMGIAEVAAFVRERQMLIVLDNCEHVVEAAAALCEMLFKTGVRTHVLVTSREPLRCRGEVIHRLQSLAAPAEHQVSSAAEALGFASVELFTERLAEHVPGFVLQDGEAALAAAICRRLDGLPLALELVAALADRYSLRGLWTRLSEAPLSLRNEARHIAPRHESLQTLLGWSHELLTPQEKRAFERLSIFKSGFSMLAAAVVAGGANSELAAISAAVVSLAQKSLLVLEPGPDGPRCRYLETTRAFAFEQLGADREEHRAVAARHAQFLCDEFERSEQRSAAMDRAAWLRNYGVLVNDVRAALDWCFGPDGDPALGVVLTVVSVPLAHQLSLWDEYMVMHDRAIAFVENSAVQVDPALELQLRTSQGLLIGQSLGPIPSMARNYEKAMEVARRGGMSQLAADALDGLWMGAFLVGDYPTALQLARECRATSGDGVEGPAPARTARMLVQSLHHMALHEDAAALAERLIEGTRQGGSRKMSSAAIDPQVSARVMLARVRWIQGRPDEAAAVMAEGLRRAEDDYSVSIAHALSWGGLPVALWRGDDALARELMERLERHCREFHLPYWGSWVTAYRVALGDLAPGPGGSADGEPFDGKRLDVLASVAPHGLTEGAIGRAESARSPWCLAEVLRVRGESLAGLPACREAAGALFERALDVARRQQAWGWELRAATSLARHFRGTPGQAQARDILGAAHARFTEGFDTRDLRQAGALLKDLA